MRDVTVMKSSDLDACVAKILGLSGEFNDSTVESAAKIAAEKLRHCANIQREAEKQGMLDAMSILAHTAPDPITQAVLGGAMTAISPEKNPIAEEADDLKPFFQGGALTQEEIDTLTKEKA